jgi:hypothetical protein
MRRAHQVLAVVFGVIGAALIAKGTVGGVWPPSVQLLFGGFLVVLAVVRWVYS